MRLGVDVGSVRVGVARCDAQGMLAVPLTTLARDLEGGADLEELARLAREEGAVEVIVGLPLGLDGTEGAAAGTVRAYVAELLRACPELPVRLVDERLSTVVAHQAMGAAGRDSRARRQLVDQAAAVAILDTFLSGMRQAGQLPGTVLRGHLPDTRKPRRRKKESGT